MSLFWDWMYLFKKTPWDTGITPPEIVAMLDSGKVPIGRALDLGCGTGTNAITLAQRGFDVTAIDVSRRAIALAQRKARSAQLTDRIRFARGDVTLLRRWALGHSIDFAYDIGCFHNLKVEARQRYVAALTAVLKPGAFYMLYAFEPQADRAGVALDEIAALFDPAYQLDGMRRGSDSGGADRGGRGSAWYTLMKRDA
jgi:cyclopropane fatty-acyl-phospholipid synthase-like methyltransferase